MLYVMLWLGMTNEDLMIGNDTEMLWYEISIQCYAMVYVVQHIIDLTVNIFVISVISCFLKNYKKYLA